LIRDGKLNQAYPYNSTFDKTYIIRVSLQTGSIDKIDVGQTNETFAFVRDVGSDVELYLLDETIFYQELKLLQAGTVMNLDKLYRLSRVDFQGNTLTFIVNWPAGSEDGFSFVLGNVIGRYLYIPLKPDLHRKMYLDKEISEFNLTQYIQKYERKEVPIFGNRWIDIYTGEYGDWPVENICISSDDFPMRHRFSPPDTGVIVID